MGVPGLDSWFVGLPAWNRDGHHPMPVLTEETLKFICFGRVDPITKRTSGGHQRDAIPRGAGKKEHSEFPACWTKETVREAFYYLMQLEPITTGSSMLFKGWYKGVEIYMRCSFNESARADEMLHMFPVRGRGVRLWRNGKEVKVGQKRRK